MLHRFVHLNMMGSRINADLPIHPAFRCPIWLTAAEYRTGTILVEAVVDAST
jgi:hypothetical protein